MEHSKRADADGTGIVEQTRAMFLETGAFGRVMPGFEPRPAQVHMAAAVAQLLEEGGLGLIEAGTGTGKSLAYLAPAALHSAAGRGRVMVSTHTHNLQAQLLHKDMPLLQEALKGLARPDDGARSGGDAGPASRGKPPVVAAELKGWTNYVCLWRLSQTAFDQQQLFPGQRDGLDRLRNWAETGGHGGTREEANFPISDELWDDVHAESDTCLRQRCPFYEDCYYFRARRRAQAADILVVNHHLVCADLAVRRHVGWDSDISVLPGADHYVFDEAHHLEDVFTQHFGLSFGRARVHRLLQRIVGRTGIIARLQHVLGPGGNNEEIEALATLLAGRAPEAAAAVQQQSDQFFAHLVYLAQHPAGADVFAEDGPDTGEEGGTGQQPTSVPLTRGLVAERFWQPLGTGLEELRNVLNQVAEQVRAAAQTMPEAEGMAWEADALARRAEAAAADLVTLAEAVDPGFVYWIERAGRQQQEWALKGAPIDVGPIVQETLLDNVGTIVMTSATLAAGDRFKYVKQRLGLKGWPGPTIEARIPSPFDYERQVLLCAVDDLPEPQQDEFWPALAGGLQKWLLASQGRAFVLFTSYRAMRKVAHILAPWLASQQMTALRQGDMSRAHLLERFRETRHAVLFGIDSFWEGVDVPGEALSLVVVTRLPFRVPSDPVAVARREALQAQGLDPFDHLTVPQAVMRFRQGFGRLIRTAQDRGVVVVADKRLIHRRYGKRFLAALPKTARFRGAAADVALAVADWLE